jgi:hypothetical protein
VDLLNDLLILLIRLTPVDPTKKGKLAKGEKQNYSSSIKTANYGGKVIVYNIVDPQLYQNHFFMFEFIVN